MGAARKLFVADLFCGAGGTSTGVAQACKELDLAVELLAINHWETAIATHTKNHPWARHLCANLDTIDPRKVIPGGHLDLLVASPECTHHSVARGGKPINDQSRASAFRVLEWCDKLDVSNVLIENVPEFQNWGPISWNTQRPVRAKVGEIFRQWIAMLEGMNYRVEYKVLNAADFGGATTRKRLFVIAKKGNARIHWPEQTHAKDADKTGDIFKKLKPWRAAREIIDWGIQGESIFTRKRPLARTTLERIAAGLRKFCGEAAEPFLVILRRHMDGKSLDEPVPCLTASGQHVGLCVPKPFITVIQENNTAKPVDKPLPTITAQGNKLFLTEFILQQQSGGAPRSVEEPPPTIAGKGAQAFFGPQFGERKGQKPRTHDVESPLPAPTSHGAGALVEPKAFIVQPAHGEGLDRRVRSIDEPLGTQPCSNEFAIVRPYVVNMKGRSDASDIDKPLPTQTTSKHLYVAEPAFIVGAGGAEGTGQPQSVEDPLRTQLTRDSRCIVQPIIVTPGGPNIPEGRPVDQPLPTVTCKDRLAVAEPFIFSMEHGKKPEVFIAPTNHGKDSRTHSVEKPMPTVTTVDAWAVVEPHLVKFYKDTKTQNQSVKEPLHTVTTKDRHGLVEPMIGTVGIDIRFRMLRPHELAAAMGFEKYQFTGSREQQVKQIGNAVEINTARALVKAILGGASCMK
jgi:DNA (cytosine-5)-methyltransferase 1